MLQQKYELRRYKFSQTDEIKMYRLFLCGKTAVKLYTAVKNMNLWRNFAMKKIQNLQEIITIKKSTDGNRYRVLTYNGVKYKEPYFTGQELGWVTDVLWDEQTKTYILLIITVGGYKLWLTINKKVAKYFDPMKLEKNAPVYFCIYQCRKFKKDRVPYNIYEIWYAPEELEGYKKPEPVQED